MFSKVVKLKQLVFNNLGNTNTFDLYLDDSGDSGWTGVLSGEGESGTWARSEDYSSISLGAGAGTTTTTVLRRWSSWFCRWEEKTIYSAFKQRSVEVEEPDPVPLPAAGVTLLAAMGGSIAANLPEAAGFELKMGDRKAAPTSSRGRCQGRAVAYARYHAAMMRTVIVGAASDHQRRMHAAAVEALEACEAAMRPGRPMGDVYDAHARVFDAHGLSHAKLRACPASCRATSRQRPRRSVASDPARRRRLAGVVQSSAAAPAPWTRRRARRPRRCSGKKTLFRMAKSVDLAIKRQPTWGMSDDSNNGASKHARGNTPARQTRILWRIADHSAKLRDYRSFVVTGRILLVSWSYVATRRVLSGRGAVTAGHFADDQSRPNPIPPPLETFRRDR
jgi:hypothetical protein